VTLFYFNFFDYNQRHVQWSAEAESQAPEGRRLDWKACWK